MSNIKRILLTLAAVLLICGATLISPVYAHEGEDDDLSQRQSNRSGISGPNHDEMDDNTKSSQLAEQFHKQGDEKINELRAQHKQRSQAERQKSCTNRKESLNKRMKQKVAHAERHKAFFDKVFIKVKNFKDTNNLNVTDYDSLVAKVDSAQTNAQANIDALKALDINIDCTSQTIGDSVSAFKQAVKANRDSLKAYRTSLHDLIKAVHQAAEANSTDQQHEQNE